MSEAMRKPRSQVVLIRCDSYDKKQVQEAVTRGVELLGGIRGFVTKGETILLKPNLLIGEKPEKCVTTHPELLRAVASLLLKEGATVSYGDSPSVGSTAAAAKKSGFRALENELDITLADFSSGREVSFDQGRQNKKFLIAQGALEADGIISLPKLKTHALERMTGAVKNQFGCVPGVLKGEFHVKLPSALEFGKMLVDLNRFLNPRLYIMDGIMAMEGNGPRGGDPNPMGVLLFSTDPVALDATVCRLIGLKPEYVPTIKYGHEFGTGTYLDKEIELLGDDFHSLVSRDFKVINEPVKSYSGDQGKIRRFLNDLLVAKPVIQKEKCVKCGMCVNICPAQPKALNWPLGADQKPDKTAVPVYDYSHCIRCYCCQEVCPEGAIVLDVPFLRRVGRGVRTVFHPRR